MYEKQLADIYMNFNQKARPMSFGRILRIDENNLWTCENLVVGKH